MYIKLDIEQFILYQVITWQCIFTTKFLNEKNHSVVLQKSLWSTGRMMYNYNFKYKNKDKLLYYKKKNKFQAHFSVILKKKKSKTIKHLLSFYRLVIGSFPLQLKNYW